MASSGLSLVTVDGAPLRIGPWRARSPFGYLAPLNDSPQLTAGTIRQACDLLAGHGYRHVISGAVPEQQARPFVDAGFVLRERLHLLRHDMSALGRPRRRLVRRTSRRDHDAILAVDNVAFEPFWRMDAASLEDTLAATPQSRLRVTGSPVVGYSAFGLAGRCGYLQRLAVHPDEQGRGLASALVFDGLRWCARKGAHSALVNTQEHNERALALYQHLGFQREPYWLVVLEARIGSTIGGSGRDDGRPRHLASRPVEPR
ncbi:MAG: GNAT family N-acetyltransferase [Acidimicrobiia bacterium]|nr:GNAT family N-acetyltransferase [Acidimicrobiia bacterium]